MLNTKLIAMPNFDSPEYETIIQRLSFEYKQKLAFEPKNYTEYYFLLSIMNQTKNPTSLKLKIPEKVFNLFNRIELIPEIRLESDIVYTRLNKIILSIFKNLDLAELEHRNIVKVKIDLEMSTKIAHVVFICKHNAEILSLLYFPVNFNADSVPNLRDCLLF